MECLAVHTKMDRAGELEVLRLHSCEPGSNLVEGGYIVIYRF